MTSGAQMRAVERQQRFAYTNSWTSNVRPKARLKLVGKYYIVAFASDAMLTRCQLACVRWQRRFCSEAR